MNILTILFFPIHEIASYFCLFTAKKLTIFKILLILLKIQIFNYDISKIFFFF